VTCPHALALGELLGVDLRVLGAAEPRPAWQGNGCVRALRYNDHG
jgi:hypothetical protein